VAGTEAGTIVVARFPLIRLRVMRSLIRELCGWRRKTSTSGVTPRTRTTRYDVAEHLGTPEEMTAYLEACLEAADGDAAFVAKALGDIARVKGIVKRPREGTSPGQPGGQIDDDLRSGGPASKRSCGEVR